MLYQAPPPPPPEPPPEKPPPLELALSGEEVMEFEAEAIVEFIICWKAMMSKQESLSFVYHEGGSQAMDLKFLTHLSETFNTYV